MCRPALRKASSRSRCSSTSKSNSILEKIWLDGRKVTFVPERSAVSPVMRSGASGSPPAKRMAYSLPSRRMSSSSHSDSAFTTETPTPWSPPETL